MRFTDQFKQVEVREKNDTNETNSCGGPPRLAMHLRNHLLITSGYPFWYCFACSRFSFIFQDDNARPHITRIVENFHERKVVMTTHIDG